jgi:integrase/recombinase XerD
MSDLATAASDYLTIRRAVGFKLERVEDRLAQFVAFAESEGATRVTCDLALRWAKQPENAEVSWWAARLCAVRGFARYLQAFDPLTEVPPTDLLPRVYVADTRAVPYLYSPAEVEALMAQARAMPFPLTAATCETLIGLLSATGMRVGEALRLDRADLDDERGVLTVRDSKNARSREVPLHPTTLEALTAYAQVRNRHWPSPVSPAMFLCRSGDRPSYITMNWHFQHLVSRAGLQPKSVRCRPRMHDFRHVFACSTLEGWYRTGVDVQPLLPLLSTYLGHLQPVSTYWYLSGKPELLALAAQRLEQSTAGLR